MNKTIQERAKEYAPDAIFPDEILPAREQHLVNLERRGYIEGATVEHELLTKWNSPDNHPIDDHYVIGKFTGDRVYRLVYYDDLWKEWKLEWTHETAHIIGWREIHE